MTLSLGEKTGGPRVSISEIAFYNSDTLSTEIADLFTDGSFTALKGDVDADKIAALQARLSALSSYYLDRARLQDELDLAQALLEQNENALGVVKNDFQSRSSSAAADQAASALQPLGVTAGLAPLWPFMPSCPTTPPSMWYPPSSMASPACGRVLPWL